ncbi:MAG: molybdopterin oxidoreductase family protein, partial [Rhodospirillales bacterium]|nr:molybdopterin oxidoreductase family protein [Rhodospirillales bacterium]
EFEAISWDEALDEVAGALLKAEQKHGSESVWPYNYAGTMGLLMRDGIERLRHTKNYSGQYDTICTTPAWQGFIAGTGILMGPDPREMGVSDLIVIWGTNPVNTQINVMTHVTKARKERGAKIVVIDTYNTGTAKQADMFLRVNPGTDGAVACAIMHVLFRDDLANRDFMEKFTDVPGELEEHLKTKTPVWASEISGVPAAHIETLAHMIGTTPRTYLRLGYGFTRSRNGATNMHAAMSIASVTGSWHVEGGGAFHNSGAIFQTDTTMIEGLDVRDPTIRILDQSRIGPILCGDKRDLGDGPPVTALFIQNTNPMSIAPDQEKVHRGFARDDLFVCVHEQFMTETAAMADIVLPATMFVEHDDIYKAGGHQHISLGLKIIDGPPDCRNNHEVLCGLAERLGVDHPGFHMTPRELIDRTLQDSGRGTLAEMEETNWLDCQPPFDESHFVNGFGHADGKFRFKPDWAGNKKRGYVDNRVMESMPQLPDHWTIIDQTSAEHPFRLVTAPARTYLNSSFNETPSSIKREGRPDVQIHPDDAAELNINDGDRVRMGNDQGSLVLHARHDTGINRGTVISEGIWPNHAFEEGKGINVLTSAEPIAPAGGAAFHDTAVWIKVAS